MSRPHETSTISFLENVASESALREHLIASIGENCNVQTRVVLHQHLYEADATTDIERIVLAYFAHLGYEPAARTQPPRVGGVECLCALELDLAYTLVEEALRWNLDDGEEMVTEVAAHQFVQHVREMSGPWAVLAFANVSIPSARASELLGYAFCRVVADVGDEAGVVLVGDQDIAMIWIVNGDDLSRGMDLGRLRARERAYASPAHRRGPQMPTEADRCRICGLPQPSPPWGARRESPTFEFCDCCGVQFGYDDATPGNAQSYRRRWLASGARWFRTRERPVDWDLKEQLSEVPRAFAIASGQP